MFDPLSITTFIGLAAAAIWAVLTARKSRMGTQLLVAGVTIAALAIALLGELLIHTDPCRDSPELVLNEICALGRNCGEVGDFVEIYNPSDKEAKLMCYAIKDRRGEVVRDWGNPFLPSRGIIRPREVKAWGERELNFNISRDGDTVGLFKLAFSSRETLVMADIDTVEIGGDAAYQYRSPDGGEWRKLSDGQLPEQFNLPSFGNANP